MTLDIDGECRSIKFRVVDAVDQPMILGMDFGRAFDIEMEWYPRKWGRRGRRWHEFVTKTGRREEASIAGECAGLSSISDEQLTEVNKLVDKALASQKDQPGFTQLIEHHICVTDEQFCKHKMRRMSEAILGGRVGPWQIGAKTR